MAAHVDELAAAVEAGDEAAQRAILDQIAREAEDEYTAGRGAEADGFHAQQQRDREAGA